MTRSKFAKAFLCVAFTLQATLSPLQAAPENPYFRFQVGKGAGTPAVGTDTSDDLRFVGGGTLPPTLQVGQSVQISFSSAGGKPTHTLSPYSMVPGLTVSPQGPRAWVLAGVLTQAGTFTGAGVRLADGSSGPIDRPVGSIVVTARPSPGSLQFTATPNLPSPMPVGLTYDGIIGFTGGSGQGEEIAGKDLPPGFFIYNDGISWHLGGTAEVAGTYPAPSYTLTDGAKPPLTHTMPDVVVTEPAAGDALRFQSIMDLPTVMAYGDWGQAYYGLAGGVPPYRLTLRNIPARFAASAMSYTLPQASEWMVEGAATTPGTYSSILVTVTDQAGATVSRTMPPVTVEDVAAKPLAFSTTQDPQGPISAQSPVEGSYGATGGVGPYAMTALDAPSLVLVQGGANDWSPPTSQGEAWHLVGAVEEPGTYRNVRIRLTDSVGTSVDHVFNLEVTGGPADKLAFAGTQDIPASVDATYSANLSYSATGGTGAGYYMELVNAPTGLSITKDDPGSDTARAFHLKGQPEQFGTFNDAYVRLEDSASNRVLHKLPPFTVTKDGLRPLSISRQLAATNKGSYSKDDRLDIMGKVEGGVRPYLVRFASGGPLDGLSVDYSPNGSGGPDRPYTDDNVLVWSQDDPALGLRSDVVVEVMDSAGDTVRFQPLTFKLTGLPLLGCNAGENPLLTVQPGQTGTLALKWSGGQAPYAFAFEGVPEELGLTATSTGTYTAELTMAPTAAMASSPGALVTITDSEGSSCSVPFAADSTSGTSANGMFDYPMPTEGFGITVGAMPNGEPLYTLTRGQIISDNKCLISDRPNCVWPDSNAHFGVELSLSTEDTTRFLIPQARNFGWSFSLVGTIPNGLLVTTPFCTSQNPDVPSSDPSCGPRFWIGAGRTNYENLRTSGIHRFRIISSRDGEIFSTRWINMRVGD